MLEFLGISLATFVMYFVGKKLRWLCCVGLYGFDRLIVVICMVRKCVFVLLVYMGRFWGLQWMRLGVWVAVWIL